NPNPQKTKNLKKKKKKKPKKKRLCKKRSKTIFNWRKTGRCPEKKAAQKRRPVGEGQEKTVKCQHHANKE
ncbi:hypothetical protein KJR58_24150, partial [Escherichia coli]|nr:hypothetical protein [Escherichia coli]